jgi:hypothetical protein
MFANEPGGGHHRLPMVSPRSGVGDDPARKNWFIIYLNLNKFRTVGATIFNSWLLLSVRLKSSHASQSGK